MCGSSYDEIVGIHVEYGTQIRGCVEMGYGRAREDSTAPARASPKKLLPISRIDELHLCGVVSRDPGSF